METKEYLKLSSTDNKSLFLPSVISLGKHHLTPGKLLSKQQPRPSHAAFEIPGLPHSLRLLGCILQVGFPKENRQKHIFSVIFIQNVLLKCIKMLQRNHI